MLSKSKMLSKRKIFSLLILVIGISLIVFGMFQRNRGLMLSPFGGKIENTEKLYDKYSFPRLSERVSPGSTIEVNEDKFYFQSEGKRISGAITYPSGFDKKHKYPVIVMARGYVEKEGYKTGTGTKNSAAVYSKNGYVTLAPDFSGYGESDPEDSNALGARLSKPVEILDLLASLKYLPYLDLTKVFLWGHSNGGQIMLSVAEILSKYDLLRGDSSKYGVKGVTLWAPVSKPFPYNILFYTDDASDSGKWLRGQISEFERDYDVFNYSIDKYFEWISIPLQIHQGSADDAVPKKWSDNLVKTLKENDKDVIYLTYPGADHNMRPSWDLVVGRDLDFFAGN